MSADAVAGYRALFELYERADLLSPGELVDWLAELRARQDPLLPQLEQMLRARSHVAEGDFLQAPPELPIHIGPVDLEWAMGTRFGAYALVRHLGSGGMSEVWLGRRVDDTFDREVAIKLLLNHPIRSERDSLAERFSRERDILASLRHPNIAELYDAGVTASGQPWLAIEYVAGEPITTFCDRLSLDLEARARVFRQVLVAVEFAHANLIVHRDLKPANILVANENDVRLLDFGIAKLLEGPGVAGEATQLTRQGGRPLTLRYASPEQVLGGALSTSSDVYSLGVLLYELLCGESPYELSRETHASLEQAIIEDEPRLPSRRRLSTEIAQARSTTTKGLREALRVDLDSIVLKALAKRTQQRYSSVESFRSDIDHWLECKPVAATAPSVVYRTRKYLYRNRWPASGVFLATLVIMIAASWAILSRIRATDREARAAAAQSFVLDIFRAADPDNVGGRNLTAGDMLEQGHERARELLRDQPELRAEVLRQIGEIQEDIGSYTSASATLEEAVETLSQIGDRRQLGLARVALADVRYRMDDLQGAASLLDRAEHAFGPGAEDTEARSNVAMLRGWIAVSQERGATAVKRMQEALSQFGAIFGKDDYRALAALRGLSYAETMTMDYGAAVEHAREAAVRADRSSSIAVPEKIRISIEGAQIKIFAGMFFVGYQELDRALTRCDRVMNPDSETCASPRLYQPEVLLLRGEPAAALRFLPTLEKQARLDSSPRRQAEAAAVLARVLAANGVLPKGGAIELQLEHIGSPTSGEARSEAAKGQAAAALVEAMLDNGENEEVIHRSGELLADFSNERTIARLTLFRGIALQRLHRDAAALVDLDAATNGMAKLFGAEHPRTLMYGLNRARSELSLGRREVALSLIDRALPVLSDSLGPDAPTLQQIRVLRRECEQGARRQVAMSDIAFYM